MNPIFLAGIIFVAGSLGGTAAARCGCPRITGYLLVGVLFSPSGFDLVPKEALEPMRAFTTLALGFIAYQIGASLPLESLKASRKSLAWITALQALFPWVISTALIMILAPFLVGFPGGFWTIHLPLALLLGAMAFPAAPAITAALVQECRARGPITTLLFGVVGITDGIGVIAYSAASGICRNLVHGDPGPFLPTILLRPLMGVLEPLAIGFALALILCLITGFIRIRALFLVTITGFSLACTGLCELAGVSSLLANLTLGFVVVNKGKGNARSMAFEDVQDLIFTAFFVITGMLFDLHAIKASGLAALVIILGRCSGKYMGARIGAAIAGTDDVIKKYFGLALLPKAGLVVGLMLDARTSFPEFGLFLFNGMLASIILNTLITAPLARFALRKTGECQAGR